MCVDCAWECPEALFRETICLYVFKFKNIKINHITLSYKNTIGCALS